MERRRRRGGGGKDGMEGWYYRRKGINSIGETNRVYHPHLWPSQCQTRALNCHRQVQACLQRVVQLLAAERIDYPYPSLIYLLGK